LARAVLLAVSGASIAAGAGLAVAASVKGNAADAQQALLQSLGPSACAHSAPARASICQQLLALRQQRDRYANMAQGLLFAGAITGAVAVASMWIVRTPETPAVQVTPMVSGRSVGVTMEGTW
jgi:hypothetical protein